MNKSFLDKENTALVSKPTIYEFVKKFPMNARATLSFPTELGENCLTVKGKGLMKFGFSPTEDPNILSVTLKDFRLKIMAFELKGFKVDEFNLTLGDIKYEDFHGMLKIDDKEISLAFIIVLSPEIIPALKELGVFTDCEIMITEKGKIDIWTGEFETHSDPFYLPARILASGCQFCSGCQTSVNLYLNVITPGFDKPRRYIKEVWICPREKVGLFWESSNDVSSCDLKPGIGTVSLNGHMDVSPTSDTIYTITADGDCEVEDSVEVHVIEEGDEYKLIARPNYETGVWNVNIPKEICSPNIIITSIRPVSCTAGPVGNAWACQKIDIDGNTTYFDIIGRTSPGDIPLAGDWTFVPIVPGGYYPQSDACFIATLRCNR